MIHNINYTQAMRLHQAVQNTDVETAAKQTESDVISKHTFLQSDIAICLQLWYILEMTLEMKF